LRNCRPRFSRAPPNPRKSLDCTFDTNQVLALKDFLGDDPILIQITATLQNISLEMDENSSHTLDRGSICRSIYDIEYELNQLNGVSSIAVNPGQPLSFEAEPVKIALHIYLYLMIRDIPKSSPLFHKLVERLLAALKVQNYHSNEKSRYSYIWRLWMLLIGFGAASKKSVADWFVYNTWLTCREMDITSSAEFGYVLRSVLWRGRRCEELKDRLWLELISIDELGTSPVEEC
jgi:hypothetical protein